MPNRGRAGGVSPGQVPANPAAAAANLLV
ncbi:hypothetical protein PSEEN0866 [Pseudomonas entomophila L48]|uniref:Uncharacterized protein n=1 Tax=Pseudomonas entomophila (strain L48) TaxID=384676 RepID=Q1IEX8_PSEE4|nr:hypothetical protein PSEEN0866 [Pseudomonas entomophila L48]